DKEGFLRSPTSLVQTIGRAARNVEGKVILYADKKTAAIEFAIKETERRRQVQEKHNREHGITPASIVKNIQGPLYQLESMDYLDVKIADKKARYQVDPKNLPKEIGRLETLMKKAAKDLEFEKAAEFRDQIVELKKQAVMG
ncbi:MAG: UvrB/UvrC motif-containing protein, partial [Deltaproteobacteria bacterium]|nr:UvrB/UvrC motif-containing protein [Deltaproteobacteria bacterium]